MLDPRHNATTTQFRQFGLAAAVLCFTAAYWFGRAPSAPATIGLLISGLGLALVTALAPNQLRIPFVLLSSLTAPIGWVVSHAILGLIYFAVITPIGLVLRLLGRTPMDLNFEPRRSTYWKRRGAPPDAVDYLRQS